MSQNLEKLRALEANHAQQRMDWEGRIREAEKLAYSKQEEVLKQLTEARNKVKNYKSRPRVIIPDSGVFGMSVHMLIIYIRE